VFTVRASSLEEVLCVFTQGTFLAGRGGPNYKRSSYPARQMPESKVLADTLMENRDILFTWLSIWTAEQCPRQGSSRTLEAAPWPPMPAPKDFGGFHPGTVWEAEIQSRAAQRHG
jgi:hypothetical protein